jgi:hypothetical protein
MKPILLLTVVALTMAGCGRKVDSSTPTQTPAAAGAAVETPAPRYVTAVAENKPAAYAAGEVNAFLTEQLRIFVQQKQRLPADFAELARVRLDSVPRPPEGRKWVIDTTTREVKAMPAQ